MPIYQKINEVMKRVTGVAKDGTNKHGGNYDYQSHNAVTRALRGHFAELGIVREAGLKSATVLKGGHVKVEGYVTYTDAEDLSEVCVPIVAVQHSQTKEGKPTAQQVGQALSYAVKNIELKLFCLTDTEEDSDATGPSPAQETKDPAGVATRAKELLEMMGLAKSPADITDVMKMVKSEWEDLKSVPSFQAAMTAQKKSAEERMTDDIPF